GGGGVGGGGGGGRADRQQLRMGGRITVTQGAVAGARDHLGPAHDRAADRHLVRRAGRTGFRKGNVHERRFWQCSFRRMNFAIRRDLSMKRAMPRKSDQDGSERGERIAKAIARAGLASRREAEAWIAAGRVAVNGQVIDSAARNVSPADRVTGDGPPAPAPRAPRLFLYHKPRGLVTTNADPEGRPTIFGALPKWLPRVLTVGRLDMGTEGLLLLTNDGGLARVLELPETGWLRRYRVRAHRPVTPGEADGLREGVTVDGIHYGPIEAALDREQGEHGANIWLTFAIREGKNREVRNVLRHLGLQVNRLIRVSFGPFQLREITEGDVEE